MSPSSAKATYRPEGAGHRARTARVDLACIPDPETWLTRRLGPLAAFEMRSIAGAEVNATDPSDAARLDALASRLTASMQSVLATRGAALDALSARLEAAAPRGSGSRPAAAGGMLPTSTCPPPPDPTVPGAPPSQQKETHP